jgi:hypothetical protein
MLFKSKQNKICLFSFNFVLSRMKDYNIRRGSSLVSFASLYGMSDYVAFALGNYKETISFR